MKFKLRTGQTVIVDDADAPLALAFTWHVIGAGYVATCYRDANGHPRCFYLKELLTGLKQVRFRNRNKLDHRRKNFAFPASPAPGVRQRNGKWEVYGPRPQLKYGGTYSTIEEAVAVRQTMGKVTSRVWTMPEAAKGKDRRKRRQYIGRLYNKPGKYWKDYFTAILRR